MQGLKPEALAGILENWDATRAPKPKILHTIPNGSNPRGGSLSEARRRALYATARAHEVLILEDDPYYFPQYAPRLVTNYATLQLCSNWIYETSVSCLCLGCLFFYLMTDSLLVILILNDGRLT